MKLSPQNSFGEYNSLSIVRLRALRELNALWAHPIFEDEKSNESEKICQAENCIRKTTGLI